MIEKNFLILVLVAVVSILSINYVNDDSTLKFSNSELEGDKILLPTDINLPKNFFFGTASSDFQSTGGNGRSDWAEHIKNMKPPQKGPGQGNDFFNHYQEDFILAAKIGIQMHRFSLEWARIEPEEGKYDMEAVKKYKEIFRFMRSRKIEPMVCLNHFALPQWFSAKGGWKNQKAWFYYARYAEFVAKQIGVPLKIKWWLTFNEPQITLMAGYIKGLWPPYQKVNLDDVEGLTNFSWTYGNLLAAHRAAYKKIHEVMEQKSIKPLISFASAAQYFEPANPKSKNDVTIVNFITAIETLSFNVASGEEQDFIGIDYYNGWRLKVHFGFSRNIEDIKIEWLKDENPENLYKLIKKFSHLNVPIVITENGIDDKEDGKRAQFILTHLKMVSKAIEEGANVIGYMYWSLTDNWEWEGYDSYYGLIEVDRQTMERRVRNSAYVYAEVIKNHQKRWQTK